MSEYSPWKVIHFPERLRAIRDGTQIVPVQVQLVITNRCNHRCLFCAYRMKGYLSNQDFCSGHEIDVCNLYSLLESMARVGVRAVQFTGGGEPLLHPHALDVMRFAKVSCGMDISLVTNGSLLDDETIAFLRDKASWVRVSLDAATPETYKTIRGPDDFAITLASLRKLSAPFRNCTVGVGFVVCHENYREAFDAAQLAESVGADNVRISAVFTPQGFKYFDGWLDEARAEAARAEQCAGIRVFNMFSDRVADCFAGVQAYSYCGTKEFSTYIGADGIIYLCCTLAYNPAGAVCNMADYGWDFGLAWSSSQKMSLFHGHNPYKHCKNPCMYEKKNRFISYCIDESPKHVNFAP